MSKPTVATPFPRGGAPSSSSLSHLEWRDTVEKAERDVRKQSKDDSGDLFKTDAGGPQRKRKRQKKPQQQQQQQQQVSDGEGEGEADGEEVIVKKKKTRVEESGGGKPLGKKSTKKGQHSKSNSSSDASSSTSLKIQHLSMKHLTIGMTLLGVVREINDLDLVLSLPNQLTGYVSITEISDEITAMVERAAGANDDDEEDKMELDETETSLPSLDHLFRIGQVVPCVVLAVDQGESDEKDKKGAKSKKKVELSLRPELVNAGLTSKDISAGMLLTASVESKQDHGYILNMGIENLPSVFLHKNHAKTYIATRNNSEPLSVGQLVSCSVLSNANNNEKRTLSVTIDPTVISSAKLQNDNKVAFTSLKAGYLVPIKVKSITDGVGIAVGFCGMFEGFVDYLHCAVGFEDDLSKQVKVGQVLDARILYADTIKKRVAFSLTEGLVNVSDVGEMMQRVSVGDLFEDAVVVGYLESGVLVKVGDDDGFTGLVATSRLSDAESP
ncbi:Protein RRP5, partial [Blyttiomyces sp. JEL0837]